MSPTPSSMAQPASTAVARGDSTREASSGPTASHATGISLLWVLYWAIATAVMARASSTANTRLAANGAGWAGPEASSGTPRPERTSN